MKELWRTRVQSKAYVDQTHRWHAGTVVYEQILVEETGERYDVDDGYAQHPELGKVVVEIAVEGLTTIPEGREPRTFGIHPETVSYFGGPHVRLMFDRPTKADGSRDETYGFWKVAPTAPRGYAYPDGAAPVEALLDERGEPRIVKMPLLVERVGRALDLGTAVIQLVEAGEPRDRIHELVDVTIDELQA